jgi:hypothetical protein
MTPNGRSPMKRRQLDNLLLTPTADDPRPTFYFEMTPRNNPPITHSEFPKLMWKTKDGTEITVDDKAEQLAKEQQGYGLLPPDSGPTDPIERLEQMFAELSPADQQFILNAERESRLNKVREQMATLPAESAKAIMESAAKRGPGRPRKTD